jgi:hypothetical protein
LRVILKQVQDDDGVMDNDNSIVVPHALKRTSVFLPKPRPVEQMHVNVWIMTIGSRWSAYSDKNTVLVAFVDKHMPIFNAFRECSNVAGPHHLTTVIFDEYGFPRKHNHHFIFIFVPMSLRRPSSGFQDHMTGTEFRQAGGRCKSTIVSA